MNKHHKTLAAANRLSLAPALTVALLTHFVFGGNALADEAHHKLATAAASAAAEAANASELTDGEVRKIDLEAGKLTLRHAEIKSLDMPAMTMVFSVKDKALIDKLKAGDKIKFRAVNEAGKYMVTDIQPAR